MTNMLPTVEPLPDPADDAELARVDLDDFPTLVVRWSHIDFGRPLPLISRWDVRPGDVVWSSHGYTLHLTDVHRTRHPVTGERNNTVHLTGHINGPTGIVQSEAYGGSLPLVARGDARF